MEIHFLNMIDILCDCCSFIVFSPLFFKGRVAYLVELW